MLNSDNPYVAGWNARVYGFKVKECPFLKRSPHHEDWVAGWRDAGNPTPLRMSMGRHQQRERDEAANIST